MIITSQQRARGNIKSGVPLLHYYYKVPDVDVDVDVEVEVEVEARSTRACVMHTFACVWGLRRTSMYYTCVDYVQSQEASAILQRK